MTSHMGAQFRDLISGNDQALIVPGAPNALSARVIEEVGFKAIYATGAGLSNSYLGMPDIGLISLNDVVANVSAMVDVVGIPVLVDADTGFGNAVNVQRAVRLLERVGAAAIQIEDQLTPKRCGHFNGKEVIATSEMVGKIHAAVDARDDDNLIVIARTDAIALEGLDAACERANAYREAGADILFIEAPTSVADMRHIVGEVPGPHMINMVEGGLTPLMTKSELLRLGYDVILYANSAMRGAVSGMRNVMEHLAKVGDTKDAEHLMISWSERQALVRKDVFDALGDRYASGAGSGAIA